MDFTPDTGDPNCCWLMEYGEGRTLIRDHGKVIYDGPTQDMPPEIQKLAAEFDTSWGPTPKPSGSPS